MEQFRPDSDRSFGYRQLRTFPQPYSIHLLCAPEVVVHAIVKDRSVEKRELIFKTRSIQFHSDRQYFVDG